MKRTPYTAAYLLYMALAVWSLLSLCSAPLQAQNYPVDVQFRVFPPYSPAFYTLGAAGGTSPVNKTQLILQLQDPLRPSLEVGLQWEIKNSQGVVRSTAPVTTAPITLVNGIPAVLNNAQLASWFDPAYFAGLGIENGQLPEGDYEICVTAFELIHQTKAGESSCAYMYVTEFDPPDLVQPLDSIIPSWPQSVQFMWQPLHPGGFPVEYTLEVWEEIPGMTPEQIVNSTPPYFVKTLAQSTSAFLTGADPQLHIGSYYLSRVTVRDRVNGPGGVPVYIFKNGGQSVVRRFKYGYAIAGEDCHAPKNLDYKLAGTQQRAYCFWDGGTPPGGGGTSSSSAAATLPPAVSGDEESTPPPAAPVFNTFYTVKWHEKGNEDPWKSKTTTQKWWELKPYKRGKTYQVVIVRACSDQEVSSDTLQIKFNKFPDERPYECGMLPIAPDTAQIDPLPELLELDTIIVNDTRVIITAASGSNGQFSGEGFFSAPLVKSAKIAVEFTNITVNDEYRMVKGEIKTKYDPTGSNILSLDSLFNLFNNGDDFTVPEITLLEGDTAYYDPNGNLVVIQNGQMSTYGPPLVVHSPSGSAVFSGGYVMPIWEGLEEPDEITPGFRMEFAKTDNTRLGFDPPLNPALYDRYENLGSYRMAYKCTARGAADELRGYVTEGGVPLEDIRIYTEHGAQLTTDINGGSMIIHVAGVEPWEKVYAMAGDTCLGVFQQAAYELLNYKVHLVSVNGAGADLDISALQNDLNATLVQGAALTTVDRSGISVTDTAAVIDCESHLMTVYSNDMRRIIQQFETDYGGDGPEPVEFYLFMVNNLQGDVQGFMPEGTNYGFIDITKGDYLKTIPHELGHGAFTLRHYWEDYGGDVNTTDNNLMDYSPAGTTLLYDQWNTMHDPRIPVPWFRGDDDAAQISINMIDIQKIKDFEVDGTYTFITPTGSYITLPGGADGIKGVRFSTFDRMFYIETGEASDYQVSVGALLGFSDKNGNSYSARFSGGHFSGYYTDNTKYVDNLSGTITANDGICIFVGINDGKFEIHTARFSSAVNNNPNNILKTFFITPYDGVEDENLTLIEYLNKNKKSNLVTQAYNFEVLLNNDDTPIEYMLNSVTAKDLLFLMLKNESKIKDYMSYFTLVNIKPNEWKAYSSCIEDQNKLDELTLSALIQRSQQKASSGSLTEAGQVLEVFKMATLEELIQSTIGTNLAKLLKTAREEGKDATTIYGIIRDNYVACEFYGLDIDTRLYVLDKFLKQGGNNDYWYTDASLIGDDGYFIIHQLVEKTPEYNKLQLLKDGFMKNDYEWIQKLWTEANAYLNGVAYDDVRGVFNTINQSIAKYYSQLNISLTNREELIDDIYGISKYQFYPGQFPYLIGMKEYGKYVLNNNYYADVALQNENGAAFRDEITNTNITIVPYNYDFENGKVRLQQVYRMFDTSPMIYDPAHPPKRETFINYNEVFDPFEPVMIVVADNYIELGLSKGMQIVVPAYMAMVYDNDIRKTIFTEKMRFIGNTVTIAVAVLAAPESGGTSLTALSALSFRVAAVVAAGDILIQDQRRSLYNVQNKSFFDAWDQFKNVVDFTALGLGASSLIENAILHARFTTWTKIRNKYQSQSIPTAIQSVLNRLKQPFISVEIPTNSALKNIKDVTASGTDGIDYFALIAKGVGGFDDDITMGKFFIGKDGGGVFDDIFIPHAPGPITPRMPARYQTTQATQLATVEAPALIESMPNTFVRLSGSSAKMKVTAPGELLTPSNYLNYNYTNTLVGEEIKVFALKNASVPEAEIIVLTKPNIAPQMVFATAKAFEKLLDEKKKRDGCTECTIHGEAVCKKFEQLKAKVGIGYDVPIQKLCTNLSVANANEVVSLLLSKSTNLVKVFLSDISPVSCPPEELGSHISDLTSVHITAWLYLYETHNNKAPKGRKNWNTVDKFKSLREAVKPFVVKFSDNSTSNPSTLVAFCSDLSQKVVAGSNVDFLDYVNDAENLNIVKNFVAHHLQPDEYDVIGEDARDNSLVGLAKDWVERSTKWSTVQGYMQNGRDYGDHAAKNLLSPNSTLAATLGINMSEYHLFREVYLYVDKTKDQYTKADVLLVKYKADNITIDNVILLETKIGTTTDYTPRQKQSYRLIANSGGMYDFELKANRSETQLQNGILITNTSGKTLETIEVIKISNQNAHKVSDHGSPNGALDVSLIPVNNYAQYIAPDNK